jgi:hypothetical protein
MLDPTAPQAVIFWCDSKRMYTLVAFMYRAPGTMLPPTFGGLLGWHKHYMMGTWMTHAWITYTTRSALATCAPFNALHARLGIHYQRYIQDVMGIDSPCSDTKGLAQPMMMH